VSRRCRHRDPRSSLTSSPLHLLPLLPEESPTSIIAYSLSHEFYKEQVEEYLSIDADNGTAKHEPSSWSSELISLKHHERESEGGGQDGQQGGGAHAAAAAARDPSAERSRGASLELQMLSSQKTHIKHRFADVDAKGRPQCTFLCQSYNSTQFEAVRRAYLDDDDDAGYIESLAVAMEWAAQGGKSGATFLKTADGRFVVKKITKTELQMFLEWAPKYFEYMSRGFFHRCASVLCKIVGVYSVGHTIKGGGRVTEQVVVMQNLFHSRDMTRVFDLKGSTRSRYVKPPVAPGNTAAGGAAAATAAGGASDTDGGDKDSEADGEADGEAPGAVAEKEKVTVVQLDENLMEFTEGRPLPLHDIAKAYLNAAVLNDSLFLSLVNVVDYSIVVGMDDSKDELVIGIIDYMRQYDILKRMERMGKSVTMIAGQAEPTIVQPENYKKRFVAAMERYFMLVPDKHSIFTLASPRAGGGASGY